MKRIALAAAVLALALPTAAGAGTSTLGTGPTGVTSNKPLQLLIEIRNAATTDFRATVDYTALKSGQVGTFTVRHCPTTWADCAADADATFAASGGPGSTHLEVDVPFPMLGQWQETFALAGGGKATAQITDYFTTP